MTRGEAELRCAQLNAEGEAGGVWLPRQTKSGEWEPVRVSGRGIRPNRPLSETIEAKPKPREADDPRPSVFRDTPYGA